MNTQLHSFHGILSHPSNVWGVRPACLVLWGLLCLGMLPLSSRADVLFQDTFAYPDGPLAAVAGAPWITQGGTAFQMNVQSGRVELTQRESEDVAAGLTPNPVSTGDLYLFLQFEVADLPRGDGNYFLHFKDAGSAQKARLWITTNGAPAGFCRLGIANNTGAPQYLPNPVGLGERHRLMVHYRVATPTRSELWLDPVTESAASGRVAAEDGNTRLTTVYGVSLRQALASGDGMGRVWVDELRVATTFEEALGTGPEPRLEVLREGDGLVLVWTAAESFQVERARSLLNPTWERMAGLIELLGSERRMKVPIGLGAAFYRLIRP